MQRSFFAKGSAALSHAKQAIPEAELQQPTAHDGCRFNASKGKENPWHVAVEYVLNVAVFVIKLLHDDSFCHEGVGEGGCFAGDMEWAQCMQLSQSAQQSTAGRRRHTI